MATFIWDRSFVTGFDEVDEQHFYLVGLINNFGKLLLENRLSEENIGDIFQELYEYTVYHFQEEETLMKDAGVDSRFLSAHTKVHQGFLAKLNEMHEQLAINELSSIKDLLDFLIHWLVYHILGMDQNMARQLTAINSGCTAEQAYLEASKEVDNATETLLNALNHLFQQVSERNHELYKLNKTLESKVAERTQELQEANLYLEKLVVTDVLTSLPNRRFAMAHLAKLWTRAEERNKPLSCLMIDVDHFKFVNDRYGHNAGDQVLTELSLLLKQTLRNDDTICRLGGDEFLVICENTDFSAAKLIAQLLCDKVSELKVQTGSDSWYGSISIGVASKQQQMQSMEELIKQADQGVYLAKSAGKNCVRSCCVSTAQVKAAS